MIDALIIIFLLLQLVGFVAALAAGNQHGRRQLAIAFYCFCFFMFGFLKFQNSALSVPTVFDLIAMSTGFLGCIFLLALWYREQAKSGDVQEEGLR